MSTFLSKYDTLIAEFPEESAAIIRLCSFLDEHGSEPTVAFRVGRLFDVARPKTFRTLVLILGSLVDMGVLSRFVRVESDALGGIGDFPSLVEVPTVMFDGRLGYEIEVRLEQVKLMYSPKRPPNLNG